MNRKEPHRQWTLRIRRRLLHLPCVFHRNQALRTAIEQAEADFELSFGFKRAEKPWEITVSDPGQAVCLQAVDYFLWALQRFYEVRRVTKPDGTVQEIREDRFLNMLWPQVGEVHDLDFGGFPGVFYNKNRPLTIEGRFSQGAGRKKGS